MKVNTIRFEVAHRCKPRGYGQWFFEINGEEFAHVGKYSDAKKTAIALAVTLKATEVVVLS